MVFVSGKSKQGPIVLKPGERSICLIEDKSKPWMVPIRVEGDIKPDKSREETFSYLEKRKKLPYKLHCGVLFEVIGESGKKHKKWSYVGSINIQKEFGFVWPKSEVNVIVDLLKPNFTPGGSISSYDR